MASFADLVLAAWVVFVGVVYFGGIYDERIGGHTWSLGTVYVAMLIFSAVHAYINHTRGSRR